MEAVTNIWNNFDNLLFDLICKKTKHQDHCHDILQDVYIKVMENIDKVEKAENIKYYLIRMADNAVADYYRDKSNKPNQIFTEVISLKDDTTVSDSSLQLADCCLRPMIDTLEPIYREALVMTELEGISQKEYAEKVGISYTNAKSRVQRARQKLKEIILNCCTYKFDKYGNILEGKKNTAKSCKN